MTRTEAEEEEVARTPDGRERQIVEVSSCGHTGLVRNLSLTIASLPGAEWTRSAGANGPEEQTMTTRKDEDRERRAGTGCGRIAPVERRILKSDQSHHTIFLSGRTTTLKTKGRRL